MSDASTTRDDPTCEQVERVRMLALTLEKVASEYPKHFNMGSWIYTDGVNPTREVMPVSHVEGAHPADCNTTGCALGWAPYATGVPATGFRFPDCAGPTDIEWSGYASYVLGIDDDAGEEGWFNYIFLSHFGQKGKEGATNAAARLWEWIDAHQDTCRE